MKTPPLLLRKGPQLPRTLSRHTSNSLFALPPVQGRRLLGFRLSPAVDLGPCSPLPASSLFPGEKLQLLPGRKTQKGTVAAP